jgi:flavin prenyltransferase
LRAFWALKDTSTDRETANSEHPTAFSVYLGALRVNVTVAVTGASGAVFGKTLLRALDGDERVARVHFVASENSLRVIAEELGISGRSGLVEKLLDRASAKIVTHSENDVGACIASGSYLSSGMIVLPCSMGTLARIANGLASNLIERAADVCLKERRTLILCLRETPFNKIHIRNIGLAADAGATIFPVMPAFYAKPAGSEEMAKHFVDRVLAHFGLPQPDAYVWKPDPE